MRPPRSSAVDQIVPHACTSADARKFIRTSVRTLTIALSEGDFRISNKDPATGHAIRKNRIYDVQTIHHLQPNVPISPPKYVKSNSFCGLPGGTCGLSRLSNRA